MILNKPTTNPIRAKIAIVAMTLSNEFFGGWPLISLQGYGENQTSSDGSKGKTAQKTKCVINSNKLAPFFPEFSRKRHRRLDFRYIEATGRKGLRPTRARRWKAVSPADPSRNAGIFHRSNHWISPAIRYFYHNPRNEIHRSAWADASDNAPPSKLTPPETT